MHTEVAFFSLAGLTDPSRHREYNEWHQFDHQPENRSLPGVRYGERWVRTPELAATSSVHDERLAAVHYLNTYGFNEPWRASFDDWTVLADQSVQLGRRPDIGYTYRPLLGLFRTIGTHVADRARVSAFALPYRPVTGVWFGLWRVESADVSARHCFSLAAETRIRYSLNVPGVAGAWSYSSMATTLDDGWQPDADGHWLNLAVAESGRFHAELVFLDGAVDTATEWLRESMPQQAAAALLFASPFLPIRPWEWEWFEPS